MTQTNDGKQLTRGQITAFWSGIVGSVIGGTAWIIAMAVSSGDWLTVAITLAVDAITIPVFAKLCISRPHSRFLILGFLLLALVVYGLGIFWWRLDVWRAPLNLDASVLMQQKKTVTYALGGMMLVLFLQFALFHWMMKRQRQRNAARR